MADLGQSSDDSDVITISRNLVPDYIELVRSDDPLVAGDTMNIGEIKLKAWKGPDFIDDPETDLAGVDWILAENWWPYQRPSLLLHPLQDTFLDIRCSQGLLRR